MRAMTKEYEDRRQRIQDVSSDERRAGYKLYQRFVREQAFIEKTRFDLFSLVRLFLGCPNLCNVQLKLFRYTVDMPRVMETAFASSMITPSGDIDWREAGVHQVHVLATALMLAKKDLDSLTLDSVSHEVFGDSCGHSRYLPCLQRIVKPLTRLRIFMLVDPPEHLREDDDDWRIDYETLDNLGGSLEQGSLNLVLRAATELRVLKLSFHCPIFDPGFDFNDVTANLEHVFQDLYIPHLYDLGLANCATNETYLTDLLLRHKATLRRLSLSGIQFTRGTGDSFFRNIGAKLPALRSVKLRGMMENEKLGCEYSFHIPGSESRRIAPRRDAIETYLLNGGQYGDPYSLPQQTCYPWEEEGYTPPGLPEKHDRVKDDPVNRYARDLLDYRI